MAGAISAVSAHSPLHHFLHVVHVHRCRRVTCQIHDLVALLKKTQRVMMELLDTEEDMEGLVFSTTRSSWTLMSPSSRQPDALLELPSVGFGSSLTASPLASAGQDEQHADAETWLNVVEVMLEVNLSAVDALLSKVRMVRDDLDSAEQHVSLVLNSGRNNVWISQVLLSAGSSAISMVMLVANIFGMNLKNAREPTDLMASRRPFNLIVGIATGGALLFLGCILILLHRYSRSQASGFAVTN